jgi:transcription elongation factor GreA
MAEQRMPITRKGYERLRADVKRMKTTDRRTVATEIEIARSHGDLRENADYDAAKEKQGMLEATIRDLDDKLARADVIDTSKLSGDRVVFGATVSVYDLGTETEKTITIVGEAEADANAGLISVSSPMARALIGKEVDDSVRVRTPGGIKKFEITDIAFNL